MNDLEVIKSQTGNDERTQNIDGSFLGYPLLEDDMGLSP
jgi:hypothetical protein